MLFNIPQFIDKEDKVVGPLTAKQLGWMFGAGAVMLVLWTVLDFSAFILASIPVVGIFGALAFYRPNNQPLIVFIFSSLSFAFRPKMYVWRRLPETAKIDKVKKTAPATKTEIRSLDQAKINDISYLLDIKRK